MVQTKQIVGWLLLILGVAIIFYSLFSSFNIFTGKTEVPKIFSSSAKSYGGSAEAFGEGGKSEVQKVGLSSGAGSLNLEAQMQKIIGEQLKDLIPADTLPKLLNLVVWSIFASILIFGGMQISSLGIKLIK